MNENTIDLEYFLISVTIGNNDIKPIVARNTFGLNVYLRIKFVSNKYPASKFISFPFKKVGI